MSTSDMDPDLHSDSSYSNSDSEQTSSSSSKFQTSILSSYLSHSSSNPKTNSTDPDLSKLKSFLSPSIPTCLICLTRIRTSDPTWSCSASCHALFHLPCIQSWAHQSQSNNNPNKINHHPSWHCPKCRHSFPKSHTPKTYHCFCGKQENPKLDPWILPHSCGEVCDRDLKPECGHKCLLLCHPGPCPPCPMTVTGKCFCGAVVTSRRCAGKEYSCFSECSKKLKCGVHTCKEKCHSGQCPPCRVKGLMKCACGRTEEEKECWQRGFRCGKDCGGMLRCGRHRCEKGCHEGECGECLLKGRRTCPCGKKEYKDVDCDVQVSNCGSTCEKVLGCGRHRCMERCHRGKCVEMCRMVVLKQCRCRGSKKEVPCYQDLVCDRKCQTVRDCGRHACRRRCCDGDCPPCPEICGRKLRCNNHKCPSPCHRGDCIPCPLMVTISCFCGETCFEVPCGAENNQKPPKCSKKCNIPRLCRHKSELRTHKCHYGACPPCKMFCGEELACGHTCKQRCHGPIPPPNPEFTVKPKKKKKDKSIECVPGSDCPPCQEVIWIPCRGQHIGEDRPVVCSKRMPFSCQNLCGNPLPCGNHYCTKSCHILKSEEYQHAEQNIMKDPSELLKSSCEECLLPCQKARDPKCSHPCLLPCHSNDCPPCKSLMKRACHCGAMVHVFECTYYNSLNHQEQQLIRSCGGPCHKKLPYCSHLCSETCHPGDCPSVNKCTKKVTVRCVCHNLKKEWRCQDVLTTYLKSGKDPKEITKTQFGVGLIPCNEECKCKIKVVDSELQQRKPKAAQTSLSDAEKVPKKRRRREKPQGIKNASKLQEIKQTIWRMLLLFLILLGFCVATYYGYKGIYWLSDLMNKIDAERQQRRYSRI